MENSAGSFKRVLQTLHTARLLQTKALTKDTPGCASHNVLPVVQLPDVLPHVGAPDAGVALDVHVVPQSEQALN